MRHQADIEDITIADAAADSRIILMSEIGDADSFMLFAPASITGGGTPIIQITYDDVPTAGGNWCTLRKAGADVGPPAQGQAKSITDDGNCVPACTGMRIHGTANFTSGPTVFKGRKSFET